MRRNKIIQKTIKIVLLFALLFYNFGMPFNIRNVNAEGNNLANIDLAYNRLNEEIFSGETAVYELNFKVAGSEAKFGPTKIEIDIPHDANFSLASTAEDLVIAEVTPTITDTKITYEFSNLVAGQSYRRLVKINTKNGTTPNDTKVVSKAKLTSTVDGSAVVKDSGNQEINVSAETPLSVSKEYIGPKGKDVGVSPNPGDTIIWKVKASVLNDLKGLSFMKEGSKIVVSDTLDGHTTYVTSYKNGATSVEGATVAVNGQEVTWTFDAPNTAQQEAKLANKEELWNTEFLVEVKVKEDTAVKTEIPNQASVKITNINPVGADINSTASNKAVAYVVNNASGLAPVQGSYLIPVVMGPKDSVGGRAPASAPNPNPEVGPDALLGFYTQYRIAAGRDWLADSASHRNPDPNTPGKKANEMRDEKLVDLQGNEYENSATDYTKNFYSIPLLLEGNNGLDYLQIHREIDNNLELNKINLQIPLLKAAKEDGEVGFTKNPKTVIHYTLEDGITKQYPVSYEHTIISGIPAVEITREDLGLKPTDHVKSYYIEYTNEDGTPVNARLGVIVYDYYTVKSGYLGPVENKIYFQGKVNYSDLEAAKRVASQIGRENLSEVAKKFNGLEYKRVYNPNVGPEPTGSKQNIGGTIGPRGAVVVAPPVYSPTGKIDITLLQKDGNVVAPGANRLSVSFENITSSAGSMTKPVELDILLPKGISVNANSLNEALKFYDSANKVSVTPGTTSVIENFDGTGQQLVRVKYDLDYVRIGEKVNVEFDVNVDEETSNDFNITAYATTNEKVLVGADSKTQDEIDANDINGNGDKTQTRLRASQEYKLLVKRDLQIKKAVKGSLDSEFGTFGHTTLGGEIEYRFTLKNTTGEKIHKLGFLDVLPTVGDKGIVDGVDRDSKFSPVLTGPIETDSGLWTVPFKDATEVYYSTASNPNRDDIYNKVATIPNAFALTNPAGATAPAWVKASDVTDWSTIRSFKVELKEGVELVDGSNIELKFKMKAPENVDPNLYASKEEELSTKEPKAAWNSFAVTTNGLLAVEPEKVGVVVTAPEYTIKITKVDAEDATKKLAGAQFKLSDASGTAIGTKATNAQGLAEFEHILAGDYKLVETAAPTGYKALTTEYQVNVANDGTITISNNDGKVTAEKDATDKTVFNVTIKNEKASIDKKVNEKEHEDLGTFEEEFTYSITTEMPSAATNFKIEDVLVDELMFADSNPVVTIGNDDLSARASKVGQKLTVDFTETDVTKYAQQAIKVTFKSKIKPGSNLGKYIDTETNKIKIPNKANYLINNDPATKVETPPVTVTPPPSKPDIDKTVNDKKEEKVAVGQETFTYKITTSIPEAATAFEIQDQLKPVLEVVGDVQVLVDGTAAGTATIGADNLLKVEFEQAFVTANAGKAVVVTYNAKVKAGSDLTDYLVNGVIQIPNSANYIINNDPTTKKEEPPTTIVTPPPSTPEIAKKVNQKEHEDLGKFEEVFTYTIETAMPESASAFKITDTLDKVLAFADNNKVTVMLGDEDVSSYATITGQVLTVDFPAAKVVANPSKKITVTFKANIIPGSDLTNYVDASGKIKVPNKASYIINNDPNITKETPPVTVTPPPSTPDIEKKVNGKTHEDLPLEQEVFNYTINTQIPEAATAFVVSDTLVEQLQLEGEVTVKVDGTVSSVATVTTENNTVKVVFAKEFTLANPGKTVEVSFNAKVRAGADLSAYVTTGKILIPNKASYEINNDPKITKETEPVTVTPSPTTPDITKKVNLKDHEDLGTFEEEFTYTINTLMPNNASHFQVKDELVAELQFVDTTAVNVMLGDEDVSRLASVSGQTLTVNFPAEIASKSAGKAITVTFKARIKEGSDLSAYVDPTTYTVKVPNRASYIINNDPKITKETPPVTVTPPPSTPNIDKKVNGKEHEDLGAFEEEFTYTIATTMPERAFAFKITDTLENVLAFAGNVTVMLGDEDVSSYATISGQTLTVDFPAEKVVAFAGENITVSFKANIVPGSDLTNYVDAETGKIKVPNTASYIINNDPKITKETPPVTVTPPPSTPDIEKKVNGKEHQELPLGEEVFNYTINTSIPEAATAFVISDTLVEQLQLEGTVTVKVDGTESNVATVTTDNNTVKVTFAKEFTLANPGKTVEVSFNAKVRAGADLSAYVTTGKILIPNKASYEINNDPKITKETGTVTVTPPPTTPDITKKVNLKEHEDLATADEEFTYTINTEMPNNASYFQVKDELVAELQFVDANAVNVMLGDEDVSNLASVSGQTLTVNFPAEIASKSAGKAITVTFKARIKEGSDLSAYVDPNTSTVKVPNIASYVINQDPKITKETPPVTVTPPPSTPDIDKKVNGKDHETLGSDVEIFTYTISTEMPRNAGAFRIEDTLENVLTFVGDVKVTIDGQAVDAHVTIDQQHLVVTFSQEQIASNQGKVIVVTFQSRIKENADLTKYMTSEGIRVPNTAKYVINNDPKFDKNTNPVTITPPNKPKRKEIVDTNDSNAMMLWISMTLLAVGGFVFTRRKKH